jgi:hypothetical protein
MATNLDPATQAALWKRARAMFARATNEIGEPSAIAAKAALSSRTRFIIAGWLARLESVVRKLLLALAAGLLQDNSQAGERGPQLRIAPASQASTPSVRPDLPAEAQRA